MGLISIPSIFYGSSIKKGSVRLKFYITGTLAAELNDNKYNGELVQISGSDYAQTNGSGSVAGVVLYNEGFIVLTGSWALESTARDYIADLTDLQTSSWQYFGAGANDGINPSSGTTLHSASFELVFEGTNYVPTITMLAHAPKGHLNYSNNPTYVKYKQSVANDNPILHPVSSSKSYVERKDLRIENTISSSYPDPTGSLKKQTFISKIGIYDDDMNLLGIASVAKPVKKLEERDFTFKLKYDI